MAERSDDELLVERFSRGDGSAFDRIVDLYSSDVALFANRLLGWPGDVDDVLQDVFLAAFLALPRFRCKCSIRTWLFAITINKCRSSARRRARRLKLYDAAAGQLTASTAESAADKTMHDAEVSQLIRRTVASLPAKYSEVIVLTSLQQMSVTQAAGILKISDNTLRVRLNRARQMLKSRLKDAIEASP